MLVFLAYKAAEHLRNLKRVSLVSYNVLFIAPRVP